MKSPALSLESPLTKLAGVGVVVERGLDRLNLKTVRDLLFFYPRRYEDYSHLAKIAGLAPGLVTLQAKVEKILFKKTFRRALTITEAILSDETGTTKAVWFNQPYIANLLKEGQTYFFAGKYEFKSNNLALQNPSFETTLGSSKSGRVSPIYSENSLINSRLIAKLVDQTLGLVDELDDELPESVRQTYQLLPIASAIKIIHQPASMKQLTAARRRLGFEELFLLILTGLVIKREIKARKSPVIPFKVTLIKKFLKALGFNLTRSQKIAAWQIFQDLTKNQPMNRLLQGDVGSGKTVVAVAAAVLTAQAGNQTALMVPTEILARQHYATVQKILKPFAVKVDLLVAGISTSSRQKVLAGIASGQTKLIIGTHSLLNEKVIFDKLGLVIIDEQHRFGVAQRQVLKSKARLTPHLLSMTATPIPRSLALVVYSDLDISIIDELPPGRLPIKTKVYLEIERPAAYSQIDQSIGNGQQVFIICPIIEESDKEGVKSVNQEYERLRQTVFAHRRIGLLHGKLKAAEKNAIMEKFAKAKIDILIATSVVEVGIDVKSATIMVIEAADRFGLAALHQLRGRVGRAHHQSYCYLFSDTSSPVAIQRLEALERTSDGFRLASIDLEMRGAGEIYGTTQHGQLDLRLADLSDSKLIASAKTAASTFIETENLVQYPLLALRLDQLKKVTSLD